MRRAVRSSSESSRRASILRRAALPARPHIDVLESRQLLSGTVYVNAAWANVSDGADPDGAGPATTFGTDSFATISGGVAGVDAGGTVNVAAGAYSEAVTIDKKLSLIGEGAASVTLTGPAGSSLITVAPSIASPAAGDDVTISGIKFDGVGGANTGVLVPQSASFNKLTLSNDAFVGIVTDAVSVNGDATTGLSARDVAIDHSTFTNNGYNTGGSGDVSMFLYNGAASFDTLTLSNGGAPVNTSITPLGGQVGIQLRGVGAQDGTGVLPMGAVSFKDVTISGKYVRSMIGLQRYSTAPATFNNVSLGGAGSQITGTFGATLRLDSVGGGSIASPTALDLGTTKFLGLDAASPQQADIEFSPDSYGFLLADGSNTTWSGAAPSVAVAPRILDYTDGTVAGASFRGLFVASGKVYVSSANGTGLDNAIDAAPTGSTIVLSGGSYSSISATAGKSLSVTGGGATIQSASPAVTVSGGSTLNLSGVTVQDVTADGQPAILVTDAGSTLNLSSSTVEQAAPNTEATPLIRTQSGGTANVNTSTLRLRNSTAAFISEGAGSTANPGSGANANTYAIVTNEDVPFDVDLSVNGNALGGFTQPAAGQGTVSFVSGNTVRYTPAAEFSGTTSFTFSLVGGFSGTVSVTVVSQNDAPTITAPATASQNEDTTAAIGGISVSDPDSTNATVTLSVGAGVLHVTPGAATVTTNDSSSVVVAGTLADVNAALATLTYAPPANFAGPQTLTINATDGTDSSTKTVAITVTNVNDAPAANADSGYTTTEDANATFTSPTLTANDTDVDGDTLTASFTGNSAQGAAVVVNADGTFTYNASASPVLNALSAGQTVVDTFTYTISDGHGGTSSATVSVTVTGVNDAPTAVDATFSVAESAPVGTAVGTVAAGDPDASDVLLYSITAGNTGGAFAINGSGQITVASPLDFETHPTYTLTVQVDDQHGGVDTAAITINVSDVDTLPTIGGPTSATINEDATLSLADQTVSDPEGTDAVTVTLTATNGSLNNTTFTGPVSGVDAFLDTVVFTPTANFNGNASVTISVADAGAAGSPATKTIAVTVTSVNDVPVAVNDTASTNEDTPVTGNVLTNDTDADTGAVLTVASVNGSAANVGTAVAIPGGSVTLNADGSYAFTPAANFNGTATFTYTVKDETGAESVASASVTVTVNPVNDAPVAKNDAFSTPEDVNKSGNVLADNGNGADSDVEGSTLTVTKVSDPSHGTVTLAANGNFTYVPAPNFNGTDSFTYKVNDGSLDSNVATVTITVVAVNDAPVAVADSYTTAEDSTLTVSGQGILANDTDIDGNALAPVLVAGPAHGVLALHADGSFTYTPTANYNGPDSFTYKATDGSADSNTVTVSLTVTPVNDAPVAVADTYATGEDTPLTILPAGGVLSNDTDAEGDALTAVLVSNVSHGTLALAADGSFTYTPAADFNGTDSFTYKANDGTADSNTVTVTLTVNGTNDAPVATADSYTTAEDTPLTVATPGVLGNDTDPDSTTLSAVLVSNVSHGTLALNGDGSFTYTPAANYNGPDSFTYKVNDGSLDSNTVTVSLTVTAVNDPVVAVDDSYTFTEDSGLNTVTPVNGLLANDTNVEGAKTVTAVNGAAGNVGTGIAITGGQLKVAADGSFEFTPNANFNGTTTFTYTVSDGDSEATATATLTVSAVNDAPTATADSYTTAEDTPLTVAAPGVLANDSDVEGSTLNAVLVSGTSHGTLTLNADGSFTYTPAANYNGPDSFTYKANDGAADSSTVTVSITVTSVNDQPVAGNDTAVTNEDTAVTVLVFTNDSDVDGGTLSLAAVSTPAHGTATIQNAATGQILYTPAANFSGTDTFTYTVSDGNGGTASATVTVTVNNVDNDAPVATNDTASTNEDTPVSGNVLANDTDADTGSTLSVDQVNGSAANVGTAVAITGGSVTVNADGTFTFTPSANFNGTTSFTYRAVDDTSLTSNVATVTITVASVNDVPTATADSYTTAEDTPLTVAAPGVLANDSDVEGTPTAVKVTDPAHGTVTLNADGSFTYTPAANFAGTDSFTYKASDGTDSSPDVTVTITVTAVNDAPVAGDDTFTINEGATLTGTVAGNDSDPDGPSLTYTLGTGTAHGTLALNPDGTFSYVNDGSDAGTDSFTYTVSDGTLSSTATVAITVNNVAPVVGALTDQTVTQSVPGPTSFGRAVTFTDPGVEGTWSYTVLADPDGAGPQPAVTVASGTTSTHGFTFTADSSSLPASTGTYTITVQVGDGEATGSTSYQLTIAPNPFVVTTFAPTPSGFNATFNRGFNGSVLNLYGANPDVIVTSGSPNGPRVRGSLVWDANSSTLSFVATGAYESDSAGRRGVLEPGTYFVKFVSGSAALTDGFGNNLDGDTGTAGLQDFTTSFTVAAPAAGTRIVSIDDFARGKGQPVNIPASASTGLPVTISERSGVSSIDFTFEIDPALLTVTSVTGLPGWDVATDMVTLANGRQRWSVTASSTTPLTDTGAGAIAFIHASVPTTATYKDSQLINLEVSEVADGNANALPVLADDAVQSVNVVADATGNGSYSGTDASQMQTWIAGFNADPTNFNNFFANYLNTDAVTVADVNNNSQLTGADVSQLQQEISAIQGGNDGSGGSTLIPPINTPVVPPVIAAAVAAPVNAVLSAPTTPAVQTTQTTASKAKKSTPKSTVVTQPVVIHAPAAVKKASSSTKSEKKPARISASVKSAVFSNVKISH